MDSRFRDQHCLMLYNDLVWADITGKLGCTISPPSEVVWFHATRVPQDTPFRTQGLLPLKAYLPALLIEVERIAEELGIPKEGGLSLSYFSKIRDN